MIARGHFTISLPAIALRSYYAASARQSKEKLEEIFSAVKCFTQEPTAQNNVCLYTYKPPNQALQNKLDKITDSASNVATKVLAQELQMTTVRQAKINSAVSATFNDIGAADKFAKNLQLHGV